MAITTEVLTGREDVEKNGWGVVAPNLLAENYPNLDSAEVTKNKVKTRVAKVPLFPKNVSYRKFGSFADIEADAGSRFQDAVVMLFNERSKTKAEAKAKASVRDLKVWDGAEIKFDGTVIDIYAEDTGATGRATTKAEAQAALAKIQEFDGDPMEQLRILTAKMLELASR
jgi:hypothetical protein